MIVPTPLPKSGMVAEGWEGDGDGSLLPWTRQRLVCSALLRTVTVADGGGIESDYGPAARKRYRDACRRQAFHLWLCPPHPTVRTQQIQYEFYSLEACSETGRRSMSVVALWSLIPRARCRTGLGEHRLPVELAAASLMSRTRRYGRGWEEVIPMVEEDTMVVPVEEELPSRWSGSGCRKPDLVFPATSSLA
jgi:hypothetical protein